MSQVLYEEIWSDAQRLRGFLEKLMSASPELFLAELLAGYRLTGRLPESQKLPGIRLRQIRHAQSVYTLRPKFCDELHEWHGGGLRTSVAAAIARCPLLGAHRDIWP
jgi:hypothetical protein